MLIEHYYVLEDTKKKEGKIPCSKVASRIEGEVGEINKHLPVLVKNAVGCYLIREETVLNFLVFEEGLRTHL